MTTISLPLPPSASTLRVTADVRAPRLEVRLEGEIDFGCCQLLQAFSEVELSGVTTVVVDLSDLEFTDVAGTRALEEFRAEHVGASREIYFVNARPSVRKVFALCGADSLAA